MKSAIECRRRAPFTASRHACGAVALVMLAATACGGPPRPLTAPPLPQLREFLRSSPDALAIAEAARAEGLLASSEDNSADLEAVAAALGIATVAELGPRVAAAVDDAPVLFAALDERRRGSRTGDTAHWVAVALLALDGRDPAEVRLRSEVAWQDDYLEDVLALRQLHQEGSLAELAIEPVLRQPQAYSVTLAPRLAAAERPRFTVRTATGYWPVFAQPGSQVIAGTIPLQRGETLEWDELRILVRQPGTARVLEPPEAQPRAFELGDDGALSPAGVATLGSGEDLEVLVQIPGVSTLVRQDSGAVAALPWDVGCCQFLQAPDVDWWVRLSSGPGTGSWVLATADAFRAGYPALQAVYERRRAARGEPLRLGPLPRAGTVDVYGGARLSYWLKGAAGAPPLMVVHGGPGLGSQYLQEPLIDTLGAARLLYFYDQRGSGYSDGHDNPELLTIDRAVLDLDQMRRAAELERVDLLAHSYGGLLALHYALSFPEHVGRLVLIDPDPATRVAWEQFRDRVAARSAPEDARRLAEITATPGWQDDARLAGTAFALRMRPYFGPAAQTRRLGVPFDAITMPNYRATAETVRRSLGDWDLRHRLDRITAPTLIIAGGDSVFSTAAMRELADGLAAAHLEVLGGVGHFPFIEAPGVFAELVVAFLER